MSGGMPRRAQLGGLLRRRRPDAAGDLGGERVELGQPRLALRRSASRRGPGSSPRSGMRVVRLSFSPARMPGNARCGAHATAGSPSSPSTTGSVTLRRRSPNDRVRTDTGTSTLSSRGLLRAPGAQRADGGRRACPAVGAGEAAQRRLLAGAGGEHRVHLRVVLAIPGGGEAGGQPAAPPARAGRRRPAPPAKAPPASTSSGRSRRIRTRCWKGRGSRAIRHECRVGGRVGSKQVTGIDWVILGAVALLALFGWAQGFIAGALALAGSPRARGSPRGSAPLVLPEGDESQWAPAFALVGAIVAGGVLAASFEGAGSAICAGGSLARVRGRRPCAGRGPDRVRGPALAWVLGAVALQAAPDIRRDVQRSVVLRQLNAVLPPTGPLLNTLRRARPVPAHRRSRGPRAGAARGDRARSGGRRVARERGQDPRHARAGVGVEGSGWVARPGVVVTNAHVVAGQDDTRVLPGGRDPGLDAQAIHFDPRNDLAVLRVPGLDAPALDIASDPESGHLGGDPRLPAQRPVRRARRPPRADARGRQPGRLRARAGAAADRRPAGRGALGQLRRPDGRRRGPRGDDDLRRHHAAGRAADTACRTPWCAPPWQTRAAAYRLGHAGAELPSAVRMGKTLVIAEKPSVGRDLPARSRARS